MTVLEIRGPRDVRYQVDLDALPHLRTYGDVKRHLRDQGIDAVGHLLNGDRKFLSSDLIDPSVTWFELQPYQVHVTVLHAGHTWNDNVDARSTPADIKIAFSSALGEIDCPLTFQGRVLSDDVTLDDLGLDVDRIELHGQLVITIVDEGEHYEVHAQSDWTLEQLSARFFEQYSMIHRDGTYFTAAPSDPEDARIRTDDSVLDIVNAVEAATIYMHTPSFFVYMRDITHRPAGSSGAGNNRPMTDPNNPNRDVRIEVRHTSTGVDLIAKYNEQNTDNPLTNADALLWRDKEITAELPLRKCSVPNDAVIEVRRDLVNVYRGEYTCGRCGVDVHLSKSEPVRCRECGYRIVYKKRTNVACQYVCR